MDNDQMHAALERARDKAGGNRELALIMERSTQAVYALFKRKSPCPPESVLRVEAGTQVSRHDLRPDIYPEGA